MSGLPPNRSEPDLAAALEKSLRERRTEPRHSDADKRSWLVDPMSEPCARCGWVRQNHRMTRGGARCPSGAAFRPTLTYADIKRLMNREGRQ